MLKSVRARVCFVAVLSVLGVLGIMSCSSGSSQPAPLPETVAVTGKVKHVFVVTLENENYAATFGTGTKAPYLATTLAAQGALLQGYYGTGHVSLDNYVSMVSGQAGTPETTSDCLTYQDFKATGSITGFGQVVGSGCVYPASVLTIADQMQAANLTWKGYMGDMGNDPTREAAACGHPTLNTTDMTQSAEAPSTAVPLGDQYASRHNPFVYFHSIIDNTSNCASHVVPLTKLATDLASVSTTPNLVFITPNLCDDGHDAPCVNGQPGGLTSINTFLQTMIPQIMASPAYQADGLIIINFDEGTSSVTVGPSGNYIVTFPGAFCCGETNGPNLAAYPQTQSLGPYTLNYTSFGGDNTGAVLLSPFIKPGTVSTVAYNHYSMLRTLEDIFGLSQLGNAAVPTLVPMGTDVFTNVH
jgi:phosphatidylinositol-3-phosphatase